MEKGNKEFTGKEVNQAFWVGFGLGMVFFGFIYLISTWIIQLI